MTATPAPIRNVPDRCPGLSRPFVASDGAIVRLRLPGGVLSADELTRVTQVARHHAAPVVQLTSRSNLQLRGLVDPLPAEASEAVLATGLIPVPSHELVRNILCSPLSGLDDAGAADLVPMARELDRALCTRENLARLPGRFLFALDDGRGDVIEESFDLAYQALAPDMGVVYCASTIHGWVVPAAEVVPALLDLAEAFVAVREAMSAPPWRVRELPGQLPAPPQAQRETDGVPAGQGRVHPIGIIGEACVVSVPLGLLSLDQADVVSDVACRRGRGELRVSPWRSLVLPEVGADGLTELVAAGLVAENDSAWTHISACIGRPGCEQSSIDTRSLATELAARFPAATLGEDAGRVPPIVHLSGCERRCGAPAGTHLELVGPADIEEILASLEGVR